MEQRNGSDAISLPRWESFLINGQDFGGDFPAGPYNRMISKLYGTGGENSETINRSRMDKQHSTLGSANGQPLYPIHESGQSKSPNITFSTSVQSRQDNMATSSHSRSQLLLGPDEKRHEDAFGRLGLSGSQVVNEEKQDKPTLNISLGVWPKHSIEEPRHDTSSTRFSSGRELMNKPTQEDDSVRFGPMYTQHVERSKQVDETRLAGTPAQAKCISDEAIVDSLPNRLVTGHGPPAGVPDPKLEKVPATLVPADGKPKEHDEKVKVDGVPPGVIFMCNGKTRQICFQFGLFGLPTHQINLVKRIVPGTKLFLFVLDSRELQGIFEATSNGGLNLSPMAFGGAFPSQVRFRICRECKPLSEKVFRKAIEDNYYAHNKFKNELSSQQVSALLQLFCPEGFVDGKVQSCQNLLPGHSIAGGTRGYSALDLAETQSEKSMDISPHNSPTVGCGEDIHVKERGLLTNVRVANGPYSMDASDNYFRSSLYGSSLQPREISVQSRMFSERVDEGNFHLKEKHQDSLHPPYTSSTLQSGDGGISGLRFSEDIEKGKSDISGLERAEHLNRVYRIYEQDQLRPQEDLEVYASQGLPHGHKRVSEDTVSLSNSHPSKKPHYYSELYEDIMFKERIPSVNVAPVNAEWIRNSQVGSRIEGPNPMQIFSNIHHVPNPKELERGLVSQPLGGPTFTNRY